MRTAIEPSYARPPAPAGSFPPEVVMRRLTLVAAAALGLSLLPRPVLAGPLLEASVGMGAQQNPSTFQRTQTSLMLAPGWEFAGILKLELGFGANLADTASSRFELELRP